MVIGQFAVTPYAANSTNKANTSGDASKVHMPGWVTRRAYEGPITVLQVGPQIATNYGAPGNTGVANVANAGSNFANGETFLVSGGTANALFTVSANSFMNLTNLSITGNTGGLASANAVTNGQYLTVSNGAVINAIVVLTTDANGSVTNTTITSGNNILNAGGEYPTGTVNGNLVISLYSNAGVLLNHANSGSAFPTSLPGGNLTFTANLSTVTQGLVNATVVQVGGVFPNGATITNNALGLFPNTSFSLNSTANGYNITFTRERHVTSLIIGANTAAFTNLPAANSPITVTVSNTGGNSTVGVGGTAAGINAVGVFVSNIATGITNTVLQAITWGAGANGGVYANNAGFWGLFGASQTNSAVVITFTNANGQVIANGTPSALTANLSVSTGGTASVAALGGRAGRVVYETLVATRFIANGGLAEGASMNLTNIIVTGNTGGLGSANAVANGDYIVVSNGVVNSTFVSVNAVATLVTDANGSVTNATGFTITANAGGGYAPYGGGLFPTGTVNTNLVISLYSSGGKLLNYANSGAAMPGGSPGGNLTFTANLSTVSANTSQYFPQ
jgi:hypothetical protein